MRDGWTQPPQSIVESWATVDRYRRASSTYSNRWVCICGVDALLASGVWSFPVPSASTGEPRPCGLPSSPVCSPSPGQQEPEGQ